jgi:hypothetical protein
MDFDSPGDAVRLVVAVVVVAALMIGAAFAEARETNRPPFTLRTLFVAIALVATAVGLIALAMLRHS